MVNKFIEENLIYTAAKNDKGHIMIGCTWQLSRVLLSPLALVSSEGLSR
jgi:hypothetical protein